MPLSSLRNDAARGLSTDPNSTSRDVTGRP
jgi:hypothetical protein